MLGPSDWLGGCEGDKGIGVGTGGKMGGAGGGADAILLDCSKADLDYSPQQTDCPANMQRQKEKEIVLIAKA